MLIIFVRFSKKNEYVLKCFNLRLVSVIYIRNNATYLIVLRASGLKAASAEAEERAIGTATTLQAVQKSYPPKGFESATFGLPVHCSTT